nr:FecR domain-containing protein [uncultured Flavobacterium sp.]
MQKEEFEKLFEGYIQNTLSEPELSRLMEVAKGNEQDNLLKEKIDSLLKENKTTETIDEHKGELILNHILSQPRDMPQAIFLPGKRNKRKRAFNFVFLAAVITVLIALGSVFFYNGETSLPITILKQNISSEKDLLAFTGKQVIHLSDGSTIILNDKSRLTYDQGNFNTKTREVTLFGEAYFDIKRNEKKPFIVHTGKVNTKVLGTAFNINAYGGADNIRVTVERGKVQVGDAERIYGVITPNQQIVIDKKTLNFEQIKIKAQNVTAWKSNYLILDNLSMEQAIAMISQKYKVTITVSNENIKKCRITASFLNDEDLDHILKVVCSVIETKYYYEQKGSIVLEGKGCDQPVF